MANFRFCDLAGTAIRLKELKFYESIYGKLSRPLTGSIGSLGLAGFPPISIEAVCNKNDEIYFLVGRGGGSSGNTPDCCLRGPRFDSYWELGIFSSFLSNQKCVLNQVPQIRFIYKKFG